MQGPVAAACFPARVLQRFTFPRPRAPALTTVSDHSSDMQIRIFRVTSTTASWPVLTPIVLVREPAVAHHMSTPQGSSTRRIASGACTQLRNRP
jgi:hypothetical protein